MLIVPATAWAQADVAALRQGNRAYAEARFDDAMAAYRRAITSRPSSTIAQFNLATALSAAGQLEAAVEVLSTLVDRLDVPSNRALAYYNLGNALARLGRLDEALSAYRASLRLRPDEDTRVNYAVVWRWRQARGEGPAPDDRIAPQRAEHLRNQARALDVPVIHKPADQPRVDVDR